MKIKTKLNEINVSISKGLNNIKVYADDINDPKKIIESIKKEIENIHGIKIKDQILKYNNKIIDDEITKIINFKENVKLNLDNDFINEKVMYYNIIIRFL